MPFIYSCCLSTRHRKSNITHRTSDIFTPYTFFPICTLYTLSSWRFHVLRTMESRENTDDKNCPIIQYPTFITWYSSSFTCHPSNVNKLRVLFPIDDFWVLIFDLLSSDSQVHLKSKIVNRKSYIHSILKSNLDAGMTGAG